MGVQPYMGEAEKLGYTLFDDGGSIFWWKDCATPGCNNQVCTWLSNTLCHPCTCGSAAALNCCKADRGRPAFTG